MLKFVWDPRKEKANQKKHGVSFEEAQSAFFDDYATQFDDEEHPGQDVISYFKAMSEDTGIPYQSLINLYLKDCVSNHRKIDLSWAKQA